MRRVSKGSWRSLALATLFETIEESVVSVSKCFANAALNLRFIPSGPQFVQSLFSVHAPSSAWKGLEYGHRYR